MLILIGTRAIGADEVKGLAGELLYQNGLVGSYQSKEALAKDLKSVIERKS